MYFTIPSYIGLRSWQKASRACYIKNYPYAQPLSRREFEVMLRCDGEHDVEFDETVAALAVKGLITVCEKGKKPSEWSRLKSYDNLYFPKMNLMITGKCNYNCLHCFNAADNAPLMTEWTFDGLCDLLDQARDVGVYALTITGGEPMAHGRFMDILREIGKRGMYLEELNTNGFYITQEILDEMKRIGCQPLIKISFDGLGYHDWMRARDGAELITLNAIKLCIQNGFQVKVQTQVNRKNISSMMPTAMFMNDAGVCEMRMIRTTETPRWRDNAGDACLGIEEYYETMLSFARDYALSGMQMDIDIWQLIKLFPTQKNYSVTPVSCAAGKYSPSIPGCRGNRGMIAVTSSGEVVPCIQMSGFLTEIGVSFGNLRDTSLKEIIGGGPYLDTICASVGEIREKNRKCAACEWFEFCTGGCRALGLLFSGQRKDFLGEDITKCLFFKNGWYTKVVNALPGWNNKSELTCHKD